MDLAAGPFALLRLCHQVETLTAKLERREVDPARSADLAFGIWDDLTAGRGSGDVGCVEGRKRHRWQQGTCAHCGAHQLETRRANVRDYTAAFRNRRVS